MKRLRALLPRDPDRERRNMELTRLTIKAAQAHDRAVQAEIESAQVVSAVRNTVKALRAASHR